MKKAPPTLHLTNEQLRVIVETSQDGINLLDLKTGIYSYLNPAQIALMGFGEEIQGISAQDIYERIHPDDRHISFEQQKEVASGKVTSKPVEYRWKVNSGEYRWFSDKRRLVRDKKGQPVALIGTIRDITKHKKVEQALKASHMRFNSIFKSSLSGVLLVDLDGRVCRVNPTAQRMIGLREDELIEKGIKSIFVQEEMLAEALKERSKTDKAVVELAMKRKDGLVFPVEVISNTFTDADGSSKTVLIFRDITKRKKSEEELKKSMKRQSFLLKLSDTLRPLSDANSIKDATTYLLTYHLGASQTSYSEYDKDSIVIHRETIHGETRPKVEVCHNDFPIPEAILRSGNCLVISDVMSYPELTEAERTRLIAHDMWAIISIPLVRENKTVAVLTVRQSTPRVWTPFEVDLVRETAQVTWAMVERARVEDELKRAQSKLQEYAVGLEKQVEERSKQLAVERERFFNMLENMPVMVCLITQDHKILFANRMFREKFGTPKGECCYEFVGCVSHPCVNCESLIPLETGKPHHWTAKFSNGMIVDAHDFPFIDVDGTKMILEADVDITDRINLQRQLQENERLAAIGATAGMVGHDIRNPLQAIIGDVYLLKDNLISIPDMPIKRDFAESLNDIEKNISYINKIVADLQDFSRPLNPQVKELNLYELVIEVFKNIAIPENINPSIEIDSKLYLKTDPTLFTRIFTNLVINAIQAMPEGGKLLMTAIKKRNHIFLSVEDTGVGIPENVKTKLFTPMTTTKAKGQGLGLAAAKRLVEALKGTITFESQEGKGTKFIVELPIY